MTGGLAPGSVLLNSREAATLVWLLVGLAFVAYKGAALTALIDVVRAFLHPKIVIPFVAMALYVAALCFGARLLDVWNPDLAKDAVIWFVVSGFVLFVGLVDASKQHGYFRSAVRRTVAVTVLLEFFLNLFAFAFFIELIVQPVIALLAVMSVVAGMEERHQPVKRLVDDMLGVIGLTFILYAAFRLSGEWQQIDVSGSALSLALPVWLTLGVLPFVFALSVYSTYESPFVRIDIAARNKRTWRMKLALLRSFHFRTVQLASLGFSWLSRIARAASYGEARRIVSEYQGAQGD